MAIQAGLTRLEEMDAAGQMVHYLDAYTFRFERRKSIHRGKLFIATMSIPGL